MPSISSTSITTTLSAAASAAVASLQQTKQQHVKLQQQHSLPIQLPYKQLSSTTMLQQHAVTTTQPTPAGTFINSFINSSSSNLMLSGLDSVAAAAATAGDSGLSNEADMSPISSTASFSSADTNQTLLNVIMASQQLQQQQQQQSLQQQSLPTTPNNSSAQCALNNRSFRTKYSQFMIITPAVSIDRDFDYETSRTTNHNSNNNNNNNNNKYAAVKRGNKSVAATTITTTSSTKTTTTIIATPIIAPATTTTTATTINNDHDIDDMSSYFNNGNVFRMSLLQGSIESGCSSDSGSFRSNYNPYFHTSRQHLLPKSTPQNFYTFSSWRWCTLICAAMRCFGGGHSTTHATYSTSFARTPYQRTRSHGATTSSAKPTTATTLNAKTKSTKNNLATPHKRLRPSTSFTAETAYEHFSAPFTTTPRKTRDHMNNITYEL